ncbi:MAG TPA: 8-amino-7-oxononanoate synthase [Streptosporangiaceae bacterium]|nr:8-amino-7-oxononanoate synthase [Streptosporangiaceae bacterium]
MPADLAPARGPADDGPLGWLHVAAQARAAAGLHRVLRPRAGRRGELDLASNDYLGLSADPRVVAAAAAASRDWGAGSTGSRLVTGTTELHAELEGELAALVGTAAGLVFSSGYLANVGAVTALSGADCVVVSEARNHASLVDGCRLSASPVVVARHLAAAERALAGRTLPRALILIEAINSADGDLLPLRDWHRLARRFGALLLIDDAHGLGVRGAGRGSVAEAGLAGEPDVIVTVTLSKSLGAQGGAVLGAPAVIEHLIDTARTFIFDTGLAPAAAAAALAAARIVAAEPLLARAVLGRAADLAAASGVLALDGPVIPVLIGDARRAFDCASALRELGVHVGCFRPPAVPSGTARLRVTARATLTDQDIDRYSAALSQVLACV